MCHIEYREEEFAWRVFTDNGSLYKSKFVVTAVGQLLQPKIPVFPGAETFKGGMVYGPHCKIPLLTAGRICRQKCCYHW